MDPQSLASTPSPAPTPGSLEGKAAPRAWEVPHTLVIIVTLMILASITTYLVPGGKYERVPKTIVVGGVEETRQVVDPESFQVIPAEPQTPWDLVNAVMKGLRHHSAMDIIFFILLVGGAFGIITETKAVDGALASLVRRLGTQERFLIPVVMLVFSLGGATFGMCEETIPFVAMAVPLALRLGYDSITGVAMVYLGAMVGFATAFLNPFTVGIAQGIAEVAPFSGFTYRLGLWVFFTAVTIWWVMRHARRVKRDPAASPTYDLDTIKRAALADTDAHAAPRMALGQKLVLITIAGGFAAIIYGALKLGWYIDEMAAIFLIMGVVAGLVTRMPFNTIAKSFSRGCADISSAAIILGFARAVLVILEDGMVMDTILHHVSRTVGGLSPFLSVQVMYAFQTATNFLVPSGSGQAALTMPIMAPLADMVGLTRQTAVLAYQFGDGFTNTIIPTSAVTMAALGMGGVPWERWARWILPLTVLYYLLGAISLLPPVLMGWTG
jgi:uncharacterized ion transporter superfamily protein YfcC